MTERLERTDGDRRPSEEAGRGLWIGLALGTPLIIYGVVELVRRAGWARAYAAGRWLAAGLVLHDFVLVPVVLLVVGAIGRGTPGWLRTPVRAAVLGSALVLAVSWPALRGYGDRADNATVHPLDYSTAVLTVLAALWLVTAAWAGCAWWRARRRAATRRRAAGSTAAARRSPRTSRRPAPG